MKLDTQEIIFSIIVPVYNVDIYLKECLDSLVTQNIPYDEYEIICVDDGSTDKSGEILDSYAKTYKNIVVIHKDNGGVSSARNCGIDISKGQYIWFVDADDYIRTNCLSALKSKVLEYQYDTIQIIPYSFNDGIENNDLNSITPEICQPEIKNHLWTYILRKEFITENKIYFDTRITYAEDAIFMLQVSPFLQNKTKVDDTVVYFYRQRPGSAMSQINTKKINSRISCALVCEEIINTKIVGDIEGAYWFKYVSIVKIMEMAITLPKSERNKIINELKQYKLFPLKYISKYTPVSRKAKTSLHKKIRNTILDYSYTRIGLVSLELFYWLQNMKPNINKK